MNNTYNKKTVIITGSSRGIGASTALYFAEKGFNVVINYVSNKEAADNLSREINEKYPVDTLVIKCDVSNESEVINMLQLTKERFGRIDVLVNNAGIAIDTLVEDKTVDNFHKTLDINLIGTFLTCKHIGQYMKEQGYGSIVNISSTNGIDSFYPYSLDYDASKAGVISLTHNFALHYAPTIRVNCIAPGWVNTEMNKELEQEYIKEECEHILLGRFSEPTEISKEIYHVAVESTYLNDSVIKIDGGRC
jgi:3-oxoacyl-[acyl-carrier protein] reductase